MVAQTGRTGLLKIDNDGGEGFQTLGGTRTRGLTINNEQVDVTNSDSTDQWRELLATAGVRNIQVQCSGIFLDGTYINTVNTLAMADTIRDWQYIHPALGTFDGPFQIANFSYNQEHNGAVTYELTLESAGVIAFTGS